MAKRVLVLCAAAAVALLSTLPGAADPPAKAKKRSTAQAAVKVPTGTYMKTCRLCTLDQDTSRYACECDSPTEKVRSYIDLTMCKLHPDGFYYLENYNGTLTCANP